MVEEDADVFCTNSYNSLELKKQKNYNKLMYDGHLTTDVQNLYFY